jgi:enoyl-CoA hydratase/carnithine racemase
MSGPPVEPVPAAEAAAWLRDGLVLDDAGRPTRPVLLVDLDGKTDDDLIGLAADATSVVIGIAEDGRCVPSDLARELACTLVRTGEQAERSLVRASDPGEAARQVARAVLHAPRAASALTRLLRVTAMSSVADGLAAESAAYSMLLASSEFHRWLNSRVRRDVPSPEHPPVRLWREGAVLEVLLDRPERRNAYSRHLRDGLVEALDLAAADDNIAEVRLSGAGPAFCSGGDLDEFGSTTDASTAHLIRLDRSVARRIAHLAKPVVVDLHGACVGAGIEIASFADRVRATPDAWFQLPEVAMGLVPGAGGTVGITRRIGRWRTAYLALSGTRLPAATADAWGLVDEIRGYS